MIMRRFLFAALLLAWPSLAWADRDAPVQIATMLQTIVNDVHPGGAACPGTSPFATDTFSGTAGSSLSTHTDGQGHTWTRIDPGSTNDALLNGSVTPWVGSNGTTDSVVYVDNGTPTCANYTTTVTYSNSTAGTAGDVGAVCRGASGNTQYISIADFATSQLFLYKAISNTYTVIAGPTAAAVASNGTLTVTCSGSTISATVSESPTGTLSLSTTDTGITAAGKAGIYVQGNSTAITVYAITNFSAQ